MSKERWKRIKHFENYEVSDSGRIRTIGRWVVHFEKRRSCVVRRFFKSIIRKTQINDDGYHVMLLRDKNKKCHGIWLHINVALAFVRKRKSLEKLEVNHKDGDKNNNNYKNLEWVTHKENMAHGVKMGLFKGPRFSRRGVSIKGGSHKRDYKLNPRRQRWDYKLKNSSRGNSSIH